MINGTTLYSPLLAGSQNFTTAAGETLSGKLNGTGQYITLGNMTAMIVQPDVLLPNGVVHVVDAVLVNTATDAAAASSARNAQKAVMRDRYEDDSEEATLLGDEHRQHETEEDLRVETASHVRVEQVSA